MGKENAKKIVDEKLPKNVDEVFRLICEGKTLSDAIVLAGNPFSLVYFRHNISDEQREILAITCGKRWVKQNWNYVQVCSKVDEIFELVKSGNTVRNAIIKAGSPFVSSTFYKILSPQQKRLLREYKCGASAGVIGSWKAREFILVNRGRGNQATPITNLFNEDTYEEDDDY